MGILTSSAATNTAKAGPSCIVIGAGVSGLAAAQALVRACVKVSVIEARNRIGGRTHTVVDERLGVPMDLGASFIHGLAGNPLHALAKQHNLALFRAGAPDQQVSYIYGPDGPPIDQELADRLGHNSLMTLFGSTEAYAQDREDSIPAASDSLATYILDSNESTLFGGLKNETEKGFARAMSESWDGWMGAELRDVSLRYWQSDVTYGGPDATITDGYKGIYQPMADEVVKQQGSTILLSEEVTGIKLDEDGDNVTIETKSVAAYQPEKRKSYKADFCVCTLPLGVLKYRPPTFTPPLPKRHLDATERLGMGLLNKIIVTYEKCFWPEKQSFITFLPSKVSEAFIPMLANRGLFAQNYKPIKGKNTLVFYCGAKFGSEIEKKTDREVQEGIHSILAHHFKRDNPDFPDKPQSVIVTRWESDPYSYGSYSYVKPTKEGVKEVSTPYDFAELSRPLWGDRLFFAGEATDPDHYATVHGPLITGQRAAQRILDAIEAEEMEADQ